MAKTSMKIKQQRPAKFSTREYNRCRICGRPRCYLRKYGICRICFRELGLQGRDPGRKEGKLVGFSCLEKRQKSGGNIVFPRLAVQRSSLIG